MARMRTRVKICGLTRQQDVRAAVDAGADAVGFVFYANSPRHVDVKTATGLAAGLPAFVTPVALFVNAPAAEVNAVIAAIPAVLLQFHGDEEPAYCESFRRPYMKALRVRPEMDVAKAVSQYATACGVLLDAYVEGIPGGTGERFDWSLIPSRLSVPFVLSGGLDAGNVASGIAAVKPWAVDVSSGVEVAKGIKDADKIAAFMQEVKHANV